MKKKRDKKGFLFGFVGALVKFIFPYKIVFKSAVPESGALLACANHISYIDPFFVREAIGRKVFFMAKKEIFRFKILDFFARRNGVIPVDRGGRDMEAVKRSLTVLKNGDVIGIFPAGTRAFKNPDAKYHDGAAVFAEKTGALVVPIHIASKNGRVRPFRRSIVTVGEAFPIEKGTDRAEGTAMIMKAVTALGETK